MGFDGKVALVTGAASGIGLATAKRFTDLGAAVVMSDIQSEKGGEEARKLADDGADVHFIQTDVSDPDDVDSLFRQIEDRVGRLDFAFNNAGTEGEMVPIADCSIDNWSRVIGVNLNSVFYCVRAEIPLIKKSRRGVIVNCSSVAGLVGVNGGVAYCASKHGMIGLTRAVALDYARENIRVNAVCPGVVDTAMVQRVYENQPETRALMDEMQPVGRMGKPEEVAAAVIWLCQPDAAFVTGAAFPVDGGWTAH